MAIVGLYLGRLRVVRGGGLVGLLVRFLSIMRWDLRGIVVGTVLCEVGGGGQGWVVSVFRSSCMICVIFWSSSPVRVYLRCICES